MTRDEEKRSCPRQKNSAPVRTERADADVRSIHEFDRDRVVDEPALDTPLEELANGFSTTLAVIERPVVDVHANERVGALAFEAACELHRVVERGCPVLQ